MAKELKELTPRSVNYSQWYQDLVIKADFGGEFRRAWLYGDQALRICYLGEDATYPRRYVQGNRSCERLFPLADPEVFLKQRS